MLSILLVAAARFDVLGDLIERSAALRAFSANYSVSASSAPAPSTIRIDFQAPDRVCVDRTADGKRTTMWCVDGVLTLQTDEIPSNARETAKVLFGRADAQAVYAELAPIESALSSAFPALERRGDVHASIGMRWSFDEKEQKANYVIDAELSEGNSTPLGWLRTLQLKSAEPREDGELWRFETDGAFQVALHKSSGFLQSFRGRSPNGEINVALTGLDLRPEALDGHFTAPTAVEGARDISSDVLKSLNRIAEMSLRRRYYRAIAGDASATWDGSLEAKVAAAVGPFFTRTVNATMAPIKEDAGKKKLGIAERLQKMVEQGKSPEEVQATREREAKYLAGRLDTLEQKFIELMGALPPDHAAQPHARELLAIEQRVLREVFERDVRGPVTREFKEAIGLKD
ncbi:MAG: hypothetical protein IT454_18370 [Planctomycetes bacterium]|nr:hypothetical protein [Planctomycetota bacterium]